MPADKTRNSDCAVTNLNRASEIILQSGKVFNEVLQRLNVYVVLYRLFICEYLMQYMYMDRPRPRL